MSKVFMSTQPDRAGGWMWLALHENGIGSAAGRGFPTRSAAEQAGKSQQFKKGVEQVWN